MDRHLPWLFRISIIYSFILYFILVYCSDALYVTVMQLRIYISYGINHQSIYLSIQWLAHHKHIPSCDIFVHHKQGVSLASDPRPLAQSQGEPA